MNFAKHLPFSLEAFAGGGLDPLSAMFPAVKHGARTDIGRKRAHNEDRFAVVPREALFVVCDGMGGPDAGEVAAELAIEAMKTTCVGRLGDDPGARLLRGVDAANRRVIAARTGHHRQGMATTIVAAVVEDSWLHLAHVGNSRAYRLRAGVIEPLTRDHSLLEELRAGNPAEPRHARRNVLTRALGVTDVVEVDVRREPVRVGDRLLLCCDGVSDLIDDATLGAYLAGIPDPQAAADHLIESANRAGGADNLTAVVIDCLRA